MFVPIFDCICTLFLFATCQSTKARKGFMVTTWQPMDNLLRSSSDEVGAARAEVERTNQDDPLLQTNELLREKGRKDARARAKPV
jgi:hypothetical protein